MPPDTRKIHTAKKTQPVAYRIRKKQKNLQARRFAPRNDGGVSAMNRRNTTALGKLISRPLHLACMR
jgi:hypothetical protein